MSKFGRRFSVYDARRAERRRENGGGDFSVAIGRGGRFRVGRGGVSLFGKSGPPCFERKRNAFNDNGFGAKRNGVERSDERDSALADDANRILFLRRILRGVGVLAGGARRGVKRTLGALGEASLSEFIVATRRRQLVALERFDRRGDGVRTLRVVDAL